MTKKLKFIWFVLKHWIFITGRYNKECDEWTNEQLKNGEINFKYGLRDHYNEFFFNRKLIRTYYHHGELAEITFENFNIRPSLWNMFLLIEELNKIEEKKKEENKQYNNKKIKEMFKNEKT